jgi:hypothetical protein
VITSCIFYILAEKVNDVKGFSGIENLDKMMYNNPNYAKEAKL